MARPVVRHCFLRLDMPQHFLNLQVSSTALRRSQEGQGLPRARHQGEDCDTKNDGGFVVNNNELMMMVIIWLMMVNNNLVGG
jgi:hypothetical protein